MRVIIKKNYDEVSRWAAAHIIETINKKNGRCVLGLPTGSTPLGVYKSLIDSCKAGKVSFANVVTFNMDEYLGLAASHPQSYHYFMWDNFFSHIDIKKENVHILNGETKDAAGECAAYEEAIRAAGGIDLFMGGMGEDGHIAFNEPFSSLHSRTRVKTLTSDTIQVNAGLFFKGDTSAVPREALTVGVGTVMDAREVMVLVTGYRKARALQAALEGPVSQSCTLSCLQLHRQAVIVCDEQATDELKVGTVRYFKDIEKST
jgi:glucosamine-6-phosphate deaminase